jgi:hypothetical protein
MSDGNATLGQQQRPGLLVRYAARFDDVLLVRWCFRGLLAGAAMVVGLDLVQLYQEERALDPEPTGGTVYLEPALPPALRPDGQPNTTVDPRDGLDIDDSALRGAVTFDLGGGGVMTVEGTIDQGAAARFAAELDRRGEYVKTVRLSSPGGSLDDAIAMATLMRERGMAAEVADGALCASSCPLILAGGTERRVGADAAIGLHQFYAAGGTVLEPAQAMADAQATAARISRHLAAMGVDPALWLHALDTPPQSLYYLSAEELRSYRLVTTTEQAALSR